MEHGGTHNFVERFNHETEGVYRPETVEALRRLVRMGRVSEETCVELLELVEYDRLATAAEADVFEQHVADSYNLPDVEGEALPPLPDNPNYARLHQMFNRDSR